MLEFGHESNIALQRVEQCFTYVRERARVDGGMASEALREAVAATGAPSVVLSGVEIALEELERCVLAFVGCVRQDLRDAKGDTSPLTAAPVGGRDAKARAGRLEGRPSPPDATAPTAGKGGHRGEGGLKPTPPLPRRPPQDSKRCVQQAKSFALGDALSCAAYLTLDALADVLGAEQSHIYLKQPTGDVLSPVVSVYHDVVPEADRNPQKVSSRTGALGDVFTSGIALNLEGSHYLGRDRTDAPPARASSVRSMLVFPLARSTAQGQVVGVVQFLDKAGSNGFSDHDESIVAQCKALPYLLKRYEDAIGTEWTFAKDLRTRFKGLERKPPMIGAAVSGVPGFISTFRPVQKVFRTKVSGNFLRYSRVLGRSGVPISTKATLVEIDAYMRELENCWKKSTDEWVYMEKSQHSVTAEASKRQRRLKQVEDKLGALEQEKGQYQTAYSAIKTELESLMAQPPSQTGKSERRQSIDRRRASSRPRSSRLPAI